MMIRILLPLLCVVAFSAQAEDWPTWRYDVQRTAESPQVLADDLGLLWSRELLRPLPAFNDVRLQFDGGYEPIVKGKRLFMASNREDKVMALDTGSGALLWEAFADGPVRLAPVAWKDKVLFGADDGCFYCVEAATGKEVWKVRPVPSARKLIGNKRLTSVWPIRGGPVVQDDRVYFAAGVWPFEGVFIFCLEAETGEQVWVNDSTGHLYGGQPHNAVAIGGIAPQGYLLIDDDELVVPSSNAYPGRFDLKTGKLKDFKLPLGGRVPGGWYASLAGKSEEKKGKRRSLLADMGINYVRHEDRLRFEGKPEVRTTIRAGDREIRFGEGYENVPGKIHSMAVAGGRLFVTTAAGGLYAFGSGAPGTNHRHTNPAPLPVQATDFSSQLLREIPRHGYGVFLGPVDADTLVHLASETSLSLVVVEKEAHRVRVLRRALSRAGVYGSRVAVWQDDPAVFAMPPYFANFVVLGEEMPTGERERIFESVRPYGGKLIVQRGGEIDIRLRAGSLPGATNYHGDFKPSLDELVRAPLGVLWFDDTLGHFKRSPQPKVIDGVMITTTKDWLDASTRTRKVDYRLLPPNFSDVYTGRVLSAEESASLKAEAVGKVDLETVQPSQYRPSNQKNAWKPGPPVAGHRQNPLTGETEARTFPKSYGCDGGFDYGHIYTMRSGTASFYDKRIDSGTINISGPRSGCTNSIVPANGVLSLPYFYKGCTCSYPLPTGLAMYSLPESHEQWTTWGRIVKEKLVGRIQRVGINFGAPADRMTEGGTLWLDFPSKGGPSPELDLVTVPENPKSYYRHSVWMEEGAGFPWVGASGVEGIESAKLRGLKPGSYRVRLFFANPTRDRRSFDILLQGQTVRQAFTLGAPLVVVAPVFEGIKSTGSLEVALAGKEGATQLSGIEIVPMSLAE